MDFSPADRGCGRASASRSPVLVRGRLTMLPPSPQRLELPLRSTSRSARSCTPRVARARVEWTNCGWPSEFSRGGNAGDGARVGRAAGRGWAWRQAWGEYLHDELVIRSKHRGRRGRSAADGAGADFSISEPKRRLHHHPSLCHESFAPSLRILARAHPHDNDDEHAGMQAYHRQIVAPTGVSHALSLRLTTHQQSGVISQLITARDSFIQVWNVIEAGVRPSNL